MSELKINPDHSKINQTNLRISKTSLKISQDDFEENIKKLIIYPTKAKFLVGVSGGADSLCLAIMLNNFANKIQADVLAVIVDHKLRSESTDEAIFVSQLLSSLGIKSVILTREDIPITTGIQNKARNDRYKLLKSYAKNNHYPYLFIAHHLDDQLETISLRKSSGENIIGDSGMSGKIISNDVILLRPFLSYTKQQILNTIKFYTDVWVEDPSNKNTKYSRVQHRNYLNSLDEESKENLISEYNENAKKRIDIEKKVLDALSKCILINSLGLIKLNLILFDKYEEKIKILVLRKLIRFSSGKFYEVRIEKIKSLLTKIETEKSFKYSLDNCLIKLKKKELIIFKNRINHINSQLSELWDNRFLYVSKYINNDAFIGKISKDIYFEQIKEKSFKKYLFTKGIDGDFIWGLPWVFNKNNDWNYKNYECFKYKSKSSLFMNFFNKK